VFKVREPGTEIAQPPTVTGDSTSLLVTRAELVATLKVNSKSERTEIYSTDFSPRRHSSDLEDPPMNPNPAETENGVSLHCLNDSDCG